MLKNLRISSKKNLVKGFHKNSVHCLIYFFQLVFPLKFCTSFVRSDVEKLTSSIIHIEDLVSVSNQNGIGNLIQNLVFKILEMKGEKILKA